MASYDLSRFYPSLDLYAMDCLALGQSVWFPVDGARASLPTECAHMKADGEVDRQEVIDVVAINVSGVMEAASMPHLAHAITMAIVLLHTTEAPQLSVFGGTRTFNSLGYVDDIFFFEI